MVWLVCVSTERPASAELKSEVEGIELTRRCSLAVVSKNSEAVLFVLNDFSEEDLRKLSISWIDPHQLSLETGGLTKTFTVPQRAHRDGYIARSSTQSGRETVVHALGQLSRRTCTSTLFTGQ